MADREIIPAGAATSDPQAAPVAERERALQFSQVFRTLMQRQGFYVPLTGSYLIVQLADRIRGIDGQGIHSNSLRAYLRGEVLPSDGKVRLLADALGVPRGVLLYAASYLTPEDLPNYPGPYTTLETLEADIAEVESLPLSEGTKERVLADLRASARILRLLAAERAQADWRTAPDEREQVIDLLIELWETPAPPPPPYTANEAPILAGREAPVAAPPAPAPVAPLPAPAPTGQRQQETPAAAPVRTEYAAYRS